MSKEATDTKTDDTKVDAKADGKVDSKADDKAILSAKPALVDKDGNFLEGWRDQWLPEDLRAEKSLDVIKTFPDLVKRTINAERMVGKNKVVVPTDKSPPEEWDAFYAAAGRPKAADGYQAEIPADLKELYPPERLKKYQEIAFKSGASQRQFAAFMQADIEAAQQLLKDEEEREKDQRIKAEDELRKEFGQAYEERLNIADRLLAEALPNEEQKMNFLENYGKDPVVIRLLSTVGARMVESRALVANLTKNIPAEIDAQIAKLRATPGYLTLDNQMTAEQRAAITQQIYDLMKQRYPEPAAAGR